MPQKDFQVPAGCELRIVTPISRQSAETPHACYIRVHPRPAADDLHSDAPQCEIFGWPVPNGVPVHIPFARRVAVYSLADCVVSVECEERRTMQDVVLVRPTDAYRQNVLALHYLLEQKRLAARHAGGEGFGPRIMIVGTIASSGKSVVCKTLANYAVRHGYHPLFVDASVACPAIGMPACVNVAELQRCIDVEDDASFVPVLHYFFGGDSLDANSPLWQSALGIVSDALEKRGARNKRSLAGGVFVDYPTVDEHAIELYDVAEHKHGAVPQDTVSPLDNIYHAILKLHVDTVVVLGSDFFRWRLMRHLESKSLGVITGVAWQRTEEMVTDVGVGGLPRIRASFPPSIPTTVSLTDGPTVCVIPFCPPAAAAGELHPLAVEALRKQKWLQHFFGTVTAPLRPSVVEVLVSDCRLVQLGGVSASSMQGLLPLDEDSSKIDPAAITYLQPTDMNLTGRILALSSAVYLKRNADVAEDSEDGAWVAVPGSTFEAKVKQLGIVGFALVREASHKMLKLVLPAPRLPQSKGCCFVVTSTVLLTS